jgi:hypothetical protein
MQRAFEQDLQKHSFFLYRTQFTRHETFVR